MFNKFKQNNQFFGDFFENVETLPKEIGTEAVAQIKGQGNSKKQNDDDANKKVAESERRRLINLLYGTSDTQGMPLTEMEGPALQQLAKQQQKKHIGNYSDIDNKIAAYRQKKAQEISAYERGMTQGTKGPKDQEEKMELWEEEQKKAEERAKKQKQMTMPGSAQSRSGEQGVVMG